LAAGNVVSEQQAAGIFATQSGFIFNNSPPLDWMLEYIFVTSRDQNSKPHSNQLKFITLLSEMLLR
jgi:hypothetical protein